MPERPPPNAFQLPIEVEARHVDGQRRVSNVAIVEWMNLGAIAHSDALGYPLERYLEIGGFFVVRRHEVDYLAAAGAGERLVLHTWPSGQLRRALAERRHLLLRGEEPIARGLTRWVYVDAETGQPKRMPPDVGQAFDPAQWEGAG